MVELNYYYTNTYIWLLYNICRHWSFFRDLSTLTLTEDGIRQLDENIPTLMCILEKNFPHHFLMHETSSCPSPARGIALGNFHYIWMYPYELSMNYLKGKAKTLANVECSIVTGSWWRKLLTLLRTSLGQKCEPKRSSKKIWW